MPSDYFDLLEIFTDQTLIDLVKIGNEILFRIQNTTDYQTIKYWSDIVCISNAILKKRSYE